MKRTLSLVAVVLSVGVGCSREEAPKNVLCAPWDARVKEIGFPAFNEVRYGCTSERFQALSTAEPREFHAALEKHSYELRIPKEATVKRARENVIAFPKGGGATYSVTVRPDGRRGYEVSVSTTTLAKDATVSASVVAELSEEALMELKRQIKKRQDTARPLLNGKGAAPKSCKGQDAVADIAKGIVKVPAKPRRAYVDGLIFGQSVTEVMKKRESLVAQAEGNSFAAYLAPTVDEKRMAPEMLVSYVGDVTVGIIDGNGKLLCRVAVDPFSGKREGKVRSLFDIERSAVLARERMLGRASSK